MARRRTQKTAARPSAAASATSKREWKYLSLATYHIKEFLKENAAARLYGESESDPLRAHILDARKLYRVLERCESPIEQLAALGFVQRWHLAAPDDETVACGAVGMFGSLSVTQQRTVETYAGRFRLDFAVTDDDGQIAFAIECDGYDYHERTRDQIERDKSRDRALTASGWTVLRFTGREIMRRPVVVVDAVEAVLFQRGAR